MIYINYHMAMVIFMVYSDRFEGFKSVSDLKDQHEILLPHGVKITKNKGKYYIKYYSEVMRDWNLFCIDLGLKIGDIGDDPNRLIILDDERDERPRDRQVVVRSNPDGSASFVGELIGMGF